MSFNGDLEHFPLVDVIQLLHMTGKTGILYLKSPKGESQLVFHEGYFVSANHLNNSVRIGTVLVDMNAITQDQLDRALVEQKEAGKKRRPLIATLLERGMIDKDTAFKGLEALIEMTIVEVLTWENGTFSLDVSKENVSDEYRYFPEKLQQEILLNAQGILMDSLRIYDEKMRDGTLSKIFFTEKITIDAEFPAFGSATGPIGHEGPETASPESPSAIDGPKEYDPGAEHRQAVTGAVPDMDAERQEQLITFLINVSMPSVSDVAAPVTAVILLTQDKLLSHSLTTVCQQKNLFIFTSDEEAGLDIVIEQTLGRDLHPVLVIDIPHEDTGEDALAFLRLKVSAYQQISILIMACCHTWHAISMKALSAGTRSIIPRPCTQCHEETYIPQMTAFLSGIGSFLKTIQPLPHAEVGHYFSAAFNQLKTLTEPPDIALVMLQFAALQFERVLTLVVAKSELIAEKSIGISAAKSQGPTAPLLFRIPLAGQSVLREVVEKGRLYYGQQNEALLTNVLYQEIGAPRSQKILVVPLVSRGKVIAVTYADFGAKPVSPPQINLFEALAQYSGSILDNALYRKSLEKPALL